MGANFAGAALAGGDASDDPLILGTVTTLIDATSCKVTLDGAATAVTAVIPSGIVVLVGARVLCASKGRVVYLQTVVSGGGSATPVAATWQVAPTGFVYTSDFQDYSAGNQQQPGIKAGPAGSNRVDMRGWVRSTSGSIPINTVLFTVAAQFRTLKLIRGHVQYLNVNAAMLVDIEPTGIVRYVGSNTPLATSYFSLNQLSWFTD